MGKLKKLAVLAIVTLMILGAGAVAVLQAASDSWVCLTGTAMYDATIGWYYPPDTTVIPDSSSRDTSVWVSDAITSDDGEGGYRHFYFGVWGDTFWIDSVCVDSVSFFYTFQVAYKLGSSYVVVFSTTDSSKTNVVHATILDSLWVPAGSHYRTILYSQLGDEDSFVVYGVMD